MILAVHNYVNTNNFFQKTKLELIHLHQKYKQLQRNAITHQNQRIKCLIPLVKNKEINILEMDKGVGTVIMKSSEYTDKLLAILSDRTKFQNVVRTTNFTNHPIISYENKLQRIIRRIIKPKVTTYEYHKLYPVGGSPGKLYGMVKVHKEGNPLRLVVCMIGTPQYHVSKYLDELFRPYVPSQYSLSSSYNLIHKLKDLNVDQFTHFVSFDVCGLFTNIPLAETIEYICETVCTPNNTAFPFNAAELKSLLYIVNESYFDCCGTLYKQIDGVSMGNPLAPVLADFFMSSIEQKMFSSNLDFQPIKYYRYVDDTLCVFEHASHIDMFLNYINSLHQNIKFTIDRPVNTCIPFLDLNISILDNVLNVGIFRKPTFTGRILHYSAPAPKSWKIGLIKCLVHRAYHLTNSWKLFNEEIDAIRNILIYNGYPVWWLHSVVKRFLNKIFSSTTTQQIGSSNNSLLDENQDGRCNYVIIKLQYVGNVSLSLKRSINKILHKLNNNRVKVVFVCRRLRTICKLKQPDPLFLRSSVVYKFQCSRDSSISYVGETGRQLIRRINEHTSSNSAIAVHIQQCTSCSSEVNNIIPQFQIIDTAKDHFDRTIKEALYIKTLRPNLNIQHISGKQSFTLNLFN